MACTLSFRSFVAPLLAAFGFVAQASCGDDSGGDTLFVPATGGQAGVGGEQSNAGDAGGGQGGEDMGGRPGVGGGATGGTGPVAGAGGGPPAACDPQAPFGTPEAVPGINSDGVEARAWLSEDRRMIYFDSDRSGQSEIYRASRASVRDAFGEVMPLGEQVNTADYEGYPALSPDGRALFFVRYVTDWEIYVSTRPNLLADFGEAALAANVNSPQGDWPGSLTSGGSLFYLHSLREGDGRIYVSTLGSSGSYEAPMLVSELNSTEGDWEPIASPSGLVMYFSSERAPTLDIYRTERVSLTDDFGPIEPASELNSSYSEAPTWVSADDCVILIDSDRNGNADLFIAERPAP